jgi:hypothetical protein
MQPAHLPMTKYYRFEANLPTRTKREIARFTH